VRFEHKLSMACCAFSLVMLPAQALTFGSIELVCPIDGKKFKVNTVLSGTELGMWLDMKPIGPTPAPWPLEKCPDNGFIIYKQNFSKAELETLRPYVQSDGYRALLDSHTNYYVASRLQIEARESSARIATTLLRATWEARGQEQYLAYATEALRWYEQVLKERSPEDKEFVTATLVAGELERRLGLFEQAKKRFLGIPDRKALRSPLDKIVDLQLELIEQRNAHPARVPTTETKPK
jgi:hypothetical protein